MIAQVCQIINNLIVEFNKLQAARPRYARSYSLHSGLRPSLVFRANTISNDMPVYLNTVDAGYKHIVGNCINVFITGINYIRIYGNCFPI